MVWGGFGVSWLHYVKTLQMCSENEGALVCSSIYHAHTHNVPGSSRPSSSHGSVHLSTPLACTVALNHKGQRWPLIFPANGSAVALGNCEGRCGREVNIISICKRGACGIL
jgi:hypothetical protein